MEEVRFQFIYGPGSQIGLGRLPARREVVPEMIPPGNTARSGQDGRQVRVRVRETIGDFE